MWLIQSKKTGIRSKKFGFGAPKKQIISLRVDPFTARRPRMIKKHICKSSAFLGRMSAGYWWSITRLIELKYKNWPKHIILAFSHWSNDNASHNGDFYGYVRGDDCTTASFPSTNLEFSSYLLSMLRDLKKKYGNQKNMVCARARPDQSVTQTKVSVRYALR